ncbi:pilus assembly protein PilX [Diaphorobacter aerolatus]|uniref:Pilus assembly protein PilX n=2 Tax=Diaphorobacter aerolatus TaxID=1288495 RepID=A0A7H0GQF1_9BURK|nr:pilus assembly protein PilX [Diaphorobacter aerolatus]
MKNPAAKPLHRCLGARLARGRTRHEGAVLVTTLMMLLVIGVLAITMFRGFGQQEMAAGNTLDKQRADEAAQSALQYGEWWLREGHASVPQNCAGVVTIVDASSLKVCNAALASATSVPWDTRFDYQPGTSFVVDADRGLSSSGDINYAALPSLHIAYLGVGGASGGSPIYQVTASAKGGREDTVSVVQSTFALTGSRVVDLSN